MKQIDIGYVIEGTEGKLLSKNIDIKQNLISSVSIDSRNISKECLFFPIIGTKNDAHKFLMDVYKKGCRNVVISDAKWGEKLCSLGDINVVLVDDTTAALQDLSKYYLENWKNLIKVGVTGSVGKTSTKEMLACVLASKYSTGKTKGNLNSGFGIPLTIFDLEEGIDAAVIEMGVGYDSYMDKLAEIVKPEAAVLTNIGKSHLEVFGTRDNLLDHKLKITQGFSKKNTLVINTDSDIISIEKVRAHTSGKFKIITVGSSEKADYRIKNICDLGVEGVKCTLDVFESESGQRKEYDFALPVIGAHNLFNAAEAAAVGSIFGISTEQAVQALKSLELVGSRLEIVRTDKYTIINDTYNASPESMKAALDVLTHSKGRRKVAVLGDMLELGEKERFYHEEVGRYAAKSDIDVLIAIGKCSSEIAAVVEMTDKHKQVLHFDDKKEVADLLPKVLKNGDLVLFKASRGMELEELVSELIK